jgi:hypothetical protein
MVDNFRISETSGISLYCASFTNCLVAAVREGTYVLVGNAIQHPAPASKSVPLQRRIIEKFLFRFSVIDRGVDVCIIDHSGSA